LGRRSAHRVLISLPEHLLSEADRVAEASGVTRSELVRRALADCIAQFDQQRLRDDCAEGYRMLAEEDLAEAEAFIGMKA